MKTITAFFKLIRWPNLVFIAITQLLYYFAIYSPLKKNDNLHNTSYWLYLLILASVCIAAAGYVINDYFDIKIDAINKPQKNVIDKIVKRRWAIIWHWILSSIGVIVSAYLSYKTNEKIIFIANFLCVVFLWFYSTTFKKKLLVGNVIIATLTAWVLLVVYFYVGADVLMYKGFEMPHAYNNYHTRKLFKITMLYVGFSFIATLIREVIKDLEDMDGDRKYGCNTMPIAWGVPVTKMFTAVWIIVAVGLLSALIVYAWLSGWWVAAIFVMALIIFPFLYLLYKLFLAKTTMHFHHLSTTIKLIMLSGILSMGLFYYF